ncbi:MAG: acetyl-CoA acetyltransferase [Candidatus Thermoplasmatota archaeon]
MLRKVAIIGLGRTQLRKETNELSYKELMYEAAVKAYEDCGLNAREDIDSFVCSSEDFLEGTSIFDEYVPDPIGGAKKPTCTIGADSGFALITAYMQILTGIVDTALVEAHSKASEILSLPHIISLAQEPIIDRVLGLHPYYIAGLEMNRFLYETKVKRKDTAYVVKKNKGNALFNPYAAYGAKLEIEDVLNSKCSFYPLSTLDISKFVDGATVLILVSEEKAKKIEREPIWIKGVGWANDSFALDSRNWASAKYALLSANTAYGRAKIRNPKKELDFVEVDDTFSYKELQHVCALNLFKKNEIKNSLEETSISGRIPVNPSGGSLGCGYSFCMSGIQRVAEAIAQLRGEAGRNQIDDAENCAVQCWSGIPTSSGSVFILSRRK